MKTLLIPLDDRPVTYNFPALVAKVAHVEALLPPRHLMGALTRPAQIDELLNYAESVIARQEPDAVIVCLDSLLYGGLITGRRSKEDVKTIMDRLERVKKWKTLSPRPPAILAQSSIMRISDNYDNTEEKEYWARFGREIFEWSACLHRLSLGEKSAPGLLESLERRIPADIRQDYLDTRRRNFSVNLALLKSMGESPDAKNPGAPFFDYLIFSQDDSGAYGLNVSEKERLIATSKQLGVSNKVAVYAGADEVLMTLFARMLISEAVRNGAANPEAVLHFSPPAAATVASRYEGQNLGTTVSSHVEASGIKMISAAAQGATTAGESEKSGGDNLGKFSLIIHGPTEAQGDHITLPGLADMSQLNTSKTVAETLELIERAPGDVIIADVAYANGGDPKLVDALLQKPELFVKVKSYGGWNTAGNTMGSVLAVATAYWFSRVTAGSQAVAVGGAASAQPGANRGLPAKDGLSDAHKQCLFVRLIDDWAYQSCVRKQLGGEPSTQKLATLIGPYIAQVNGALAMEPRVRMSFPWKRTFEIEINFEGS